MFPLPASLVMSGSADCICGCFWGWDGFEDGYGQLGNNYFSNGSTFLSIAEKLIVCVFRL